MAALDPGPLDLRCFSQDSRSAGVVSMLYNGVSNRSRDWKSTGLLGPLGEDSRVSRGLGVKRWDGAARLSSGWDNLRKDPELWYKNGNCFVHLYEKGQSQREPAFKIPIACLLSAKCEPMVKRFADRSITEETTSQHGRIDLYIPAPPTASRSQALQYHIATRNFFAWVCRRSMVGHYLGDALVALVTSMREFRDDDADNYQDLLGYLDEEAYLDMSNHPTHALAILQLAENFQFKDMYIDALAHCVGMNERLHKSPGYSRISVSSQELIRRARVDLDHRLSHAGAMLRDLLEQELSEAHLGLSTGARAHLDRFRAYIHSFYTIKFECFPPPPANPKCSTIFKPEVYRAMRVDFEALYDESKLRPDQRLIAHAAVMTATNRTKVHLLANGLVLAYRKFEENSVLAPHKADRVERLNLSHGDARKVRWIFVYATYQTLRSCTEVPEEVKCQDEVKYHLAVSTKGLLLPWEFQVQDGALPSPRSISDGVDATDKSLPTPKARRNSISGIPSAIRFVLPPKTEPQPTSTSIEIKPDIDYYALTHRDESPSRERLTVNQPVVRSGSLSRNMSLRRSISKLRISSIQHPSTAKEKVRAKLSHNQSQNNRKSVYHEIIINGYGNGANGTNVHESTEIMDDVLPDLKESTESPPHLEVDTTQMAGRSASTSSASSYGSESSTPSNSGNSWSTTPTTVDGGSCSSRFSSSNWDNTGNVEGLADTTGSSEIPITSNEQQQDDLEVPVRRRSTCKSIRKMFSTDDMPGGAESKAEPPPLPRRSSKRSDNKASASKRWTLIDIVAPLRERDDDSDSDSDIEPSPLRPRKARGTWRKASPPADVVEQDGEVLSDYEWEKTMHSAIDVSPPWSWEQYTDLGGLQPASPTL
ncbi:hypothetical protein VMCG_06587 [Cytospora schulzeri]|uniref:DUF8004 domain-containing protein n=1 Tax=Cytospora schulzeri TaxID=448051 RepID=A0A423W6T8_9PEZI|nr:hypothetical protein VMCG_06587 [Valsa malicola]